MSTTTMMNASNRRNKQLAAIHVMAHKLRLDETTYRALLERVAGVRSATDLDGRGRASVLDEMRRLMGDGARQMRNAVDLPGAPQDVRAEVAAMVGKIGAILADTDKSWAYAHGTAKRMFHIARVEWCRPDQLHKLVAALSYHQRRHAKDAR